MIVSVKFEDSLNPGTFSGKNYHYESAIPLQLGDLVILPTSGRDGVGIVTGVNIPESKVDERVLPLLKEITQKAPPAKAG